MENNPYLGPRAYRETDTVGLYGREREADELLDLFIAERLIVLYSPSGAGKTSLIEAELVPALTELGFRVFPRIRVGLEPRSAPASNRYVLSALMSLDGESVALRPWRMSSLASMQLENYFGEQRASPEIRGDVLIFDQFEEIFTLNAADQDKKLEFFAQLGGIMRNRSRWVLLSMREEFLGNLDAFVKHLPTRLSTRYRLGLLGPDAATQAISGPARKHGAVLTQEAVSKLVDDLREVKEVDAASGRTCKIPGPTVEPVQLQVVCHELWRNLAASELKRDEAGVLVIGKSEVEARGSVDEALRSYYTHAVTSVARETKVTERAIRTWISAQLITPQRLRNQVMRDFRSTAGLENAVIDRLADAYLVRTERRRGLVWYELSHDRLLDPIIADNEGWLAENQTDLQRMAEFWNLHGRSKRMLLREDALDEAERYARTNPGLTSVEREFLSVSREREAQRRLRQARIRTVVAVTIGILGLIVGAMSLHNSRLETRAVASTREVNVGRQQKDSIYDVIRTALESPDSVARGEATQRLRSIITADSLTTAAIQNPVQDTGGVTTAPSQLVVQYFSKQADSALVQVALTPLGYRLQGRTSAPGAGGPVTTSVLYGDVPIEDVQRVALALIAAGVKLKRVAPFDNRDRRAEMKIQVLGQHMQNVVAAPVLTPDAIRSLGPERKEIGPRVR